MLENQRSQRFPEPTVGRLTTVPSFPSSTERREPCGLRLFGFAVRALRSVFLSKTISFTAGTASRLSRGGGIGYLRNY
jgi:hypothetical protein